MQLYDMVVWFDDKMVFALVMWYRFYFFPLLLILLLLCLVYERFVVSFRKTKQNKRLKMHFHTLCIEIIVLLI